ncbi:TlpA family protein disulfide reductase [Nocardioides ganghwensis]|jgi:thiol-disulfide isomerase/thioredoxin|uniref:TlpA family protein disulfide reductase n=1 Tax=Nocardioides ganghwensis TaxID=252230 RepID=A0A4Q2SGW5_9ACTN|nr:TlpA disulfide reductase family protein [Nocardioides ganghwensis]MBD3946416.1 TlpA family protein disulfide reductase [Nocardioides ganghwensis]RYC03169.1 TlpA family protein disulfide reductase [Nocardioides ganghwensis]
MIRAVLVLLLAAALTACTSDGGRIDVRPPDIDVDTPALREVKARIGMEDCEPGTGEPVEGGLPELTLPCLGGGPDIELSSLRGPVVINLWQAFCEPCREEMPALEEFHQQYGDRVPVLGIDFNDVHPDSALALAEETGATYPSIADPGGELMAEEAFAVARRGLPAFVFVDAEGQVVAQDSGGVESVAEIKAKVAEHLGIAL